MRSITHTRGVMIIVIGTDTRDIWPKWWMVIGMEINHATIEAVKLLCIHMIANVNGPDIRLFTWGKHLRCTCGERSTREATTPKLN